MVQDPQPEATGTRLERLEDRLATVEECLGRLGDEVRTRQLIVVDEQDHPRIVGEVFGDVAELRLELPGTLSEPGPELLLFAVARSHPGPDDLGAALGLQLRTADGALFEIDAWPDERGVWRPHLHAGGG
jgi:hypothetical protein